MKKKICGAKTKAGTPCKRSPMENGRCYRHGGATPKGADSANFIHGSYSKYVQKDIADKVIAFQDADPFDLTNELALARGLLADFISKMDMPMGATAHETVAMLIDKIRKTVADINRIKNDSALTAAEITYLAARAADVVSRYIHDPAKQKAFIQDLFGGIAGSDPAIPDNITIEEDSG